MRRFWYFDVSKWPGGKKSCISVSVQNGGVASAWLNHAWTEPSNKPQRLQKSQNTTQRNQGSPSDTPRHPQTASDTIDTTVYIFKYSRWLSGASVYEDAFDHPVPIIPIPIISKWVGWLVGWEHPSKCRRLHQQLLSRLKFERWERYWGDTNNASFKTWILSGGARRRLTWKPDLALSDSVL